MNVTRFCIKIQKRNYNWSNLKIDEYINKKYCKDVGIDDNKEKYNELILKEWDKMGINIKSLYSKDDIIVLGETERIKYFLINEYNKELVSKNEISLDVLIIYDNEDIDFTINNVIRDIKRIVRFTKVKVIVREEIHLFIKSENKLDISNEFKYIKANFLKKQKLYKPEVIQFIIVLAVSIVGLKFAFDEMFENNENIKNILIGIGASGIVFDISLAIIRICELIKRDEKITIKDLNNFEINRSQPKSQLLNSDMEALPGRSGEKFVEMANDLENFDPEDEEYEN